MFQIKKPNTSNPKKTMSQKHPQNNKYSFNYIEPSQSLGIRMTEILRKMLLDEKIKVAKKLKISNSELMPEEQLIQHIIDRIYQTVQAKYQPKNRIQFTDICNQLLDSIYQKHMSNNVDPILHTQYSLTNPSAQTIPGITPYSHGGGFNTSILNSNMANNPNSNIGFNNLKTSQSSALNNQLAGNFTRDRDTRGLNMEANRPGGEHRQSDYAAHGQNQSCGGIMPN